MKNILFLFAVIGAILASCSNNEVNEIISTKADQQISFRTLRDKTVTRAANDSASAYAVYAKIADATDWFINDLVITETGTYESDYYWPNASTEISFYSFAPASGDGVTVGTPTIATPTIPITFTVPTDADTDFTIATPVKTAKTSTGIVPLSFNHMLSKVKISAQLSTDLTTSKYALSSGYKATLGVPNSVGTADAAAASPALTPATTATSAVYSGDTIYYILPQTYTANTTAWNTSTGADVASNGNCYVTLTDVTITNSGVTVFPTSGTTGGTLKAYYLESADITSETFLAGKQYNFMITITDLAYDSGGNPVFNGKISFTSTVADWDPDNVDIDQPNGEQDDDD